MPLFSPTRLSFFLATLEVLLQSTALAYAEAKLPRQGTVSQADWTAYTSRFVTSDGRVVDDGNGNISHSESQGYGLLLAYLANDEATFDQIWTFTKTNLWLRDDGLFVWKWDPNSKPHITDPNNASDGDILIAYSLALANRAWNRPELKASAERIARAISEKLLFKHDDAWLLSPAAEGFSAKDRPDGPVVNLSYWVFEAMPVLADLLSTQEWEELSVAGLQLVQDARFGPDALPSDWISVRASAAPADGFPAEFGYNAIRVPLYLMRAGYLSPPLLLPFLSAMAPAENGLAIIDVETGAIKKRLTDPGYAAIGTALQCVLAGGASSEKLRTFEPTLYYPSTLHLLVLSYINEHHPRCR
ncbi:endoglucanase [Roseibium sp. RKSG952]|nr:endoglucanase [Roseibium sp. RKSG952]